MINLDKEVLQIIQSTEVLEPETLRQVHPDISEKEFNQIMALKVLRSTHGFWENCYIFEDMVQALNNRVPDPKQIQGCTPEEIWYAVELAHRLFPDHEFSKEVTLYIKYFLNQFGVYIYPPYLDLPNPYFSKAVYLSEHGPFPLGETTEEIQAAKYLSITEAIKGK